MATTLNRDVTKDSSSPLRVALTRPVGANARLGAALNDLGIATSEIPLVAISLLRGGVEALAEAVGNGEGVWLAVTSANATEAVAQAVDLLGFQPQLAAIGPATAAAAQHRHLRVSLVAPKATAHSLAEALAEKHPQLVVWSQATNPLPDLALGLERYGIAVAQIPTYATVPATLGEADLSELLRGDLISVASPSAVTALSTLAQGAQIPALVSIGPTTTEAARAAGLSVLAQAETPSLEAMVAAIAHAEVALKLQRLGR